MVWGVGVEGVGRGGIGSFGLDRLGVGALVVLIGNCGKDMRELWEIGMGGW